MAHKNCSRFIDCHKQNFLVCLQLFVLAHPLDNISTSVTNIPYYTVKLTVHSFIRLHGGNGGLIYSLLDAWGQ